MADFNLAAITDVNRIVNQIKNGYDIRPDKYYDMVLMDKIKLGNEHYVHTKYTESFTLPAGTKKIQKRRWGGLTAHTTPLLEGIPPAPDKTSMEYIEFSATQFGRYMEFTDRVSLDQIDPQLHLYTVELGDVMSRTFERYARETLLSAASKLYANNRNSVGELIVGDKVTIADLRFLVLRFGRLMVKPLNGYFNYICSPEQLYDLLEDPLVQRYMSINQTTKNLYDNGEPFPLFQIKFIPTMLDEFYTPEIDNVGEWYDGTADDFKLRVYGINPAEKNVIYYGNVAAVIKGTEGAEDTENRKVNNNVTYLRDGTALKGQVRWVSTKPALSGTVKHTTNESTGAVTITDATQAEINAATWVQLPVHRGILFGADGLAKISIGGEDNIKTYVQGLGSAGTNDPIHQRQTIGVKVNSIGYGIVRDEAVCVTFSVPTAALATSHLTADVVGLGFGGRTHASVVGGEEDVATDILTEQVYGVGSKEITKGETVKAPEGTNDI